MPKSIDSFTLDELSRAVGLKFIASKNIDDLKSFFKHQSHLKSWQNSGYASDLSYMLRESQLFTDLNSFLPGIRSIASFIIPYNQSSSNILESKSGFGKVARYAWGRDYHRVIKNKINEIAKSLIKFYPNLKYKIFTDSVPILERALAHDIGQGFFGKNTMLITPGIGSYFFIAELLLDADITQPNESKFIKKIFKAEKASCGKCFKCAYSCPTQAIVAEYQLNAEKCISYLTIEKKQIFSKSESQMIGDWIFGCDICQEVCPYNSNTVKAGNENIFISDHLNGPYVDLIETLNIKTKDEFLSKYAGTSIMRTKRTGLIRNALAIIANTNYFQALDSIYSICQNDNDSIILESAYLTLSRLFLNAEGLDKKRIKKILDERNNKNYCFI